MRLTTVWGMWRFSDTIVPSAERTMYCTWTQEQFQKNPWCHCSPSVSVNTVGSHCIRQTINAGIERGLDPPQAERHTAQQLIFHFFNEGDYSLSILYKQSPLKTFHLEYLHINKWLCKTYIYIIDFRFSLKTVLADRKWTEGNVCNSCQGRWYKNISILID